MKGFRSFLFRGNVVDLAVAVVIGVAFNAVVSSLVRAFITPIIGIFANKQTFASLQVTIGGAQFQYGLFVNALISFVIVAAVVYFLLVAPVGKVISLAQRRQEATETDCPECLSTIPAKATRCKFCTAVLPPANQATAS